MRLCKFQVYNCTVYHCELHCVHFRIFSFREKAIMTLNTPVVFVNESLVPGLPVSKG